MTPARCDILVCTFAYGGNGGTAMILPELAQWTTRAIIKMKSDERIGRIQPETLSDTPINMTRNRAVEMAQDGGFDMILMLDSDNEPDGYINADPEAKPFWDVAFNFAYERLIKGIPTVIAAPYCGPPPHPVGRKGIQDGGEVPYLFEWVDDESDTPSPRHKLDILKRNEAARLKGIYPVAALPTGVCLFTTSAFTGLKHPYFDYEWNERHSEKHSTEDVFATRNISLYWRMTKDIDVTFAACDSWALHHKPKKVGKPRVVPVEVMSRSFRDSLANNISALDSKVHVDYMQDLPRRSQVLRHDQDVVYISDEEFAAAEAELAAEQASSVREDVDAPEQDDEPQNSNGHTQAPFLAHRMVCGKKIALLDINVTDQELEAISSLGAWISQQSGGPIEAVVLHSGTGLSTAAILAAIPEGSHVYCLDNLLVQPHGKLKADEFARAFERELESGRVMCEIEDRSIANPESPQDVDLVFIESGLDPDLLAGWIRHVRTGGLIAGLGLENHPWLKDTVLNIKSKVGGVWAAQIGVEAKA